MNYLSKVKSATAKSYKQRPRLKVMKLGSKDSLVTTLTQIPSNENGEYEVIYLKQSDTLMLGDGVDKAFIKICNASEVDDLVVNYKEGSDQLFINSYKRRVSVLLPNASEAVKVKIVLSDNEDGVSEEVDIPRTETSYIKKVDDVSKSEKKNIFSAAKEAYYADGVPVAKVTKTTIERDNLVKLFRTGHVTSMHYDQIKDTLKFAFSTTARGKQEFKLKYFSKIILKYGLLSQMLSLTFEPSRTG